MRTFNIACNTPSTGCYPQIRKSQQIQLYDKYFMWLILQEFFGLWVKASAQHRRFAGPQTRFDPAPLTWTPHL